MTPLLTALALSLALGAEPECGDCTFQKAVPADAGVAKAAPKPPKKAGARTLTLVFTGDNGGEVAPCG